MKIKTLRSVHCDSESEKRKGPLYASRVGLYSTIVHVIVCFENPGDKLRVGEVLSKQSQLYLDLGVNPPTPYAETSL